MADRPNVGSILRRPIPGGRYIKAAILGGTILIFVGLLVLRFYFLRMPTQSRVSAIESSLAAAGLPWTFSPSTGTYQWASVTGETIDLNVSSIPTIEDKPQFRPWDQSGRRLFLSGNPPVVVFVFECQGQSIIGLYKSLGATHTAEESDTLARFFRATDLRAGTVTNVPSSSP